MPATIDLQYLSSVLQRMLQIGNVDFDTAAGDDYNFVFAGVSEPGEVVHMVDTATRRGGTEGLGDEPDAPAEPTPAS